MSTTIRVGEGLRDRLETLKQERELASYEELIEELLEKESERLSMFGADEELDAWDREEDRAGFEDE
ncbi:MAG: hypothetical protein ABEK16_00485 [Candidatus Nanohalobium sp.]